MTQQEKNDIIATRIMGWHSPEWDGRSWHSGRGYQRNKAAFNPCSSLDDCFLAEEKILEKGPAQFVASYLDNLAELVAKHGKYTSYALGREFRSIHATPQQKVDAMLKALEIQ